MKLHIFNPEHDISLSYDKPFITIPHAAQELRANLGYLPALWADDGDFVLVDDIEFALKALAPYRKLAADVVFVVKEDLAALPLDGISAWGWDKRVRGELSTCGVDEALLPADSDLSFIRCFSDRRHTSALLHEVREGVEEKTCGESFLCTTLDEVEDCVERYGRVVVKAPWSSSGRGVRYVDASVDETKGAWIRKIIEKQSHVMVEPHYNKVADFAVEFSSDGRGCVKSCGLSVFNTINGKYTGNIIAAEDFKRERLSRYVDMSLLDETIGRYERILGGLIGDSYSGPLGIDMMAVAAPGADGFLLHPCVEINLRRTMGHVALSLSQKHLEFASMMSISHNVNYQFRIERIEGKFVNVIFR